MIKAAFFDVDGTLLSHTTKSVPESARDALERLKAAGIHCVVATGRHITEMEKLPVADIPFDGYITLNGQIILDREKKILHGTPITGDAEDYLLKLFREKTVPVLLVEEDRMYLNFADERVARVQADISTDVPPVGEYNGGTIYQICVYLREDEEAILATIADSCEITRWNRGGVDVIAKGGGKVRGIQRYLEANGLNREETIAFGDGDNDTQMLKFAHIGVAMGNAWPGTKEAADYITDHVDHDGIANALRHFGLID